MAMIVRAFPLRGTVEEVQSFAALLSGERKSEAAAFYRKYGITHDSWHLQDTPAGPWVIGVTIGDDPIAERGAELATSTTEFDSWFKSQVKRITGIDQDVQPLGPPTTQLFAWVDDQRPADGRPR